ncbi:MAG: permease prefix domain 1-containing protein [Faecalibacterium sp.]|nr:permease prefix domain 1-containing protein [Ruminococcus sp.]MCM1392696.1 permease prefix domain 1-containing protein [Ruminococcus sp.]MCM1486377.1 permease prefix domain 1-containing protein [Faecalibacterium sp.]
MQLPEFVSEYLEKAVPTTISEKRHKKLSDELKCHIMDKAEHYMEIGYSEKESYKKSVAEMGDGEKVREQFNKIYGEKKSHVIIFAVVFMLIHILIWKSEYFYYVTSFGTIDWIFVGTLYAVALTSIIAVAYKFRRKYTLLAISTTLLMLIVLPHESLFKPVGFTLTESIKYIIGLFSEKTIYITSTFTALLAFIIKISIFATCVYLFRKIDHNKPKRILKIKFNEKAYYLAVAAFAVTSVCTCILSINLMSENYKLYTASDYSLTFCEIESEIHDKIDRKHLRKAFERITQYTTFSMADEFLRAEGFVMYDELYNAQKNEANGDYYDYDFEIIQSKNNAVVYVNSLKDIKYIDHYIVISKENNKDDTIKYKHASFPDSLSSRWILPDNKIQYADDVFSSLKKGDKKSDVLKKFEKSDAILTSVTVEYFSVKPVEKYVYVVNGLIGEDWFGFGFIFEDDKLIQYESIKNEELEDTGFTIKEYINYKLSEYISNNTSR